MFPKEPVELGQPNTLIWHVDKFFPPVLNVTWLCNGQIVTKGITETVFLPTTEFRFHKFHYLTFLPMAEDVYDCKVKHWGLDQLLLQHWGMEPRPFASAVLTPSLFPGSISQQHLLSLISCVLLSLYPNFTGDLTVSNSSYSYTWGQLLLSVPFNSVFLLCLRGSGADPSAWDERDCGLCPGPGGRCGGHPHWHRCPEDQATRQHPQVQGLLWVIPVLVPGTQCKTGGSPVGVVNGKEKHFNRGSSSTWYFRITD